MKDYIEILKKLKHILERAVENNKNEIFLCHKFVNIVSPISDDAAPNIKNKNRYLTLNKYPQFIEWIDKIGKEIRENYKTGDAWYYNDCGDDEGVEGDDCCPYVENDEKLDLLTEYINELKAQLDDK